MNLPRKGIGVRVLVAVLLFCASAAGIAVDPDYPSRAIRLIVPFAAGGSPDLWPAFSLRAR